VDHASRYLLARAKYDKDSGAPPTVYEGPRTAWVRLLPGKLLYSSASNSAMKPWKSIEKRCDLTCGYCVGQPALFADLSDGGSAKMLLKVLAIDANVGSTPIGSAPNRTSISNLSCKEERQEAP